MKRAHKNGAKYIHANLHSHEILNQWGKNRASQEFSEVGGNKGFIQRIKKADLGT